MKKSNIIIISFLTLTIASLFGFCIWVKNHPNLSYKITDYPLGEFSVVNVTDTAVKNYYYSKVTFTETDSANCISFEAADTIDIGKYIFTVGDTLFVQNLQTIKCEIFVNNRINSLAIRHCNIELSNQLLDTLNFAAVLADSSSVKITEKEDRFESLCEVNISAKENSEINFHKTNIQKAVYEIENSSEVYFSKSNVEKIEGKILHTKK